MLFIRPIQAKLTRQTNILLAMDPYCLFIYEGKQYKTNPNMAGGQKPKWTETLSFDIKTINVLRVQVWSRSMIGNDSLIGRAEMDLRRLMLVPGRTVQGRIRGYTEHVQLFFEGKSAGRILIQLTFAAQAFKKKSLMEQKQMNPVHQVIVNPYQIMNPYEAAKTRQQQNIQNKMLPPQTNGFFFPQNNRPNNHLYTSEVQSPEQELVNNMAKMNLQPKYADNQKPSGPQIIPPGQMHGLAHRRLNQQRPTTPQYQMNHAPTNFQNTGPTQTPSFGQSLPLFPQEYRGSIPQKLNEQGNQNFSSTNSLNLRENNLRSSRERTEGLRSSQVKPILSKGKDRKRSRSNKKVSFNV